MIVALGAWTGRFLADQLADERWVAAVKPRRGLLLEVRSPGIHVGHGMMEAGYTRHYDGSGAAHDAVDVTFTATTEAHGLLLLGSSREFVPLEHSSRHSDDVVDAIMQARAGLRCR